MVESCLTAIWMPDSKYGSEKSNVCLRSSVIDMPAMTPATCPDCNDCRAASKPTDLMSTVKPPRSATSRIRSMSMPVSSPLVSRNSNGAKVVSVAIANVLPTTSGLGEGAACATGTARRPPAISTATAAESRRT